MRYYYPVWKQLKEQKVVSITANRLHHPRIVKAVVKEKWMDLGYKIIIDPKIALLSHTIQGAVLTFYLELKDRPLTARDLGLFSDIDPSLENTVEHLERIAEILDKGLEEL